MKKLLSKFRDPSELQKRYLVRFVLRCFVFAGSVLVWLRRPKQFEVVGGWNFFRRFSALHLLWAVWMFDMIQQLLYCPGRLPLGSQKYRGAYFRRDGRSFGSQELSRYVEKSGRGAFFVALLSAGGTAALGALYFGGVVKRNALVVISAALYVCDVICVVFGCPLRAWILKNRCCTTCRIYNWDHMMMFLPLALIPGFWTWSLCAMAFAVLLAWELAFARHPERFWEGTNEALRCENCTDRLCGKPENMEL